jgi:hypothetical protein
VDDLVEQVEDALAKGATLHTGGRRGERPGAYYEPGVLTGVTPEMRAYSEELFGPVAVVHRAASAEEAIALANESPYGLAASIYTADLARARTLAEDLESGMVWINGTSKSSPDLPFGGVKLRCGTRARQVRYRRVREQEARPDSALTAPPGAGVAGGARRVRGARRVCHRTACGSGAGRRARPGRVHAGRTSRGPAGARRRGTPPAQVSPNSRILR